MSIKIHPRCQKVREASLELGTVLCGIAKKHDLTPAELNGIILEQAMRWNQYAIRDERHPGDPGKKADEA